MITIEGKPKRHPAPLLLRVVRYVARGAARRASQSSIGSRGLTLIEVVAALGIIAVGIVGILALFPTGLKQSGEAADRTTGAILGEYVVEQVRLNHELIGPDFDTDRALRVDALNWPNYNFQGKTYTFDADADGDDDPLTLPSGVDAYGSGEQIMKQMPAPIQPGDLTDTDLYSRYEVTLKFDTVLGKNGAPNDAFTLPSGGKELMQVTVTIRWPRAKDEKGRVKQNTMTFVTFIRPAAS